MDEIFIKIQQMLGHAFDQGMAYQRMTDAQQDFNSASGEVATLWHEVRETLVPPEDEDGTPDKKKVN